MALVLAFVYTGHVTGLILAMLLSPHPDISPGTCLRSQRRHSSNFTAISQDQHTV